MVFLVGVVGNISACHADARGSIPRRGAFCKANLDSVKELPSGGRRFNVIPPKARGTITSKRYWLLCHCHLVKSDTFSIFAVSSLRRGHANLLCIVPIFTDDAEAFRTGNELPPLPMTGGFPASLWWRAQARLEKLLGGSGEHHRAGHWLKFSTSNQMASVYTSRAHLLPPVQERPSECEHPYPTGGSTALQSRL